MDDVHAHEKWAMDELKKALSASAEPKDWCSTMERHKSQCGCPDCGSSIIQVSELPEDSEEPEVKS